MRFNPAKPVSAACVHSKVERDMLAHGMKAMVRAWVKRDGMERFDHACYGGVTMADAVAHYSDAIKAAQRRNPSIKVGRADVLDLTSGESHRVVEIGGCDEIRTT